MHENCSFSVGCKMKTFPIRMHWKILSETVCDSLIYNFVQQSFVQFLPNQHRIQFGRPLPTTKTLRSANLSVSSTHFQTVAPNRIFARCYCLQRISSCVLLMSCSNPRAILFRHCKYGHIFVCGTFRFTERRSVLGPAGPPYIYAERRS